MAAVLVKRSVDKFVVRDLSEISGGGGGVGVGILNLGSEMR